MSVKQLPAICAALLGGMIGLLLARLVLRLFAARPDNPVVGAVLALTTPLIAPLAGLDAQQPRFGATLEFATIVLLVACVVLLSGLWSLRRRWR